MPQTPGVPDNAAGLRAANARLRELLAERDAEIAVLRGQVAEVAELRARAAALQAEAAGLQLQVADLAARVGMNSGNSSKPPSSDGLAKPAPQSLRAKSGRKPGRPKGQPGATMRLSDRPDHVARHGPARCGTCGGDLAGARETGMERRQVTEIPPVKAEVTEHQLIERECGCGARTRGKAPDGVTAPVQYGQRAGRLPVARAVPVEGPGLRRDGGHARLRPVAGRARGDDQENRRADRPALDAVVKALLRAEVAHFDETGFRVAGRLAWVHSASSGKFVLVTVHAKRGKDGMDAAGVLGSPGSPATTPGRPTTATPASPGTPCATSTCCAS